ncbi:MAG: thiamine pyrophosphate-binding protein [Geminicoccaceae bacterium]
MSARQTRNRAADLLARRLAEAGCRFAFGIPGGEILTLIDALAAAGITFVTTKHETAAGFMAEAVWQRTGTPPVLVATVGPGITNAVNVVANARLDRVPLIVLVGAIDADEQLAYAGHRSPKAAGLPPSKGRLPALTATAADASPPSARWRWRATRGQPGADRCRSLWPVRRRPRRRPSTTPRRHPRLAGTGARQARSWLAEAKRPLVIAGFDAVQHDAGAALARFAETQRAPVIQTYKAKGVLPEDHAFALAAAFRRWRTGSSRPRSSRPTSSCSPATMRSRCAATGSIPGTPRGSG